MCVVCVCFFFPSLSLAPLPQCSALVVSCWALSCWAGLALDWRWAGAGLGTGHHWAGRAVYLGRYMVYIRYMPSLAASTPCTLPPVPPTVLWYCALPTAHDPLPSTPERRPLKPDSATDLTASVPCPSEMRSSRLHQTLQYMPPLTTRCSSCTYLLLSSSSSSSSSLPL